MNIIIEEFNRVDSAFKTFRNNLKINNKIANCIELDLLENLVKEVINNYEKYHESQQDLIKGKDEYIAKLIDENKKLKDKLKEYKSVEQEIGIDLITFVKLNKTDKIYDKEEEDFMYFNWIDLKDKCLVGEDDFDENSGSFLHYYYYFKDYGKKWALTKEELEKKQ